MKTIIIRLIAASVILLGVSVAEAGRVGGPGSKAFLVQGFKTHTVKVKFTPNQPAAVQVVGDGDAPLAVAVFDASGRQVTVDSRNTDRFLLRWTSNSDQPYHIRVFNRGGVPVRFMLKTN
jgi:hypothetical protein